MTGLLEAPPAPTGRARPLSSDSSDPILLRGTHNPPGVGAWFALLIGGLCTAAALKFILFDDAIDVAPYPAAVAGGAVLWFLIAWLRKGSFELRLNWITGRKRMGGRFELCLDAVAQVRVKNGHAQLLAPDGRELVRLVSARPEQTAGLLWFLVRYRRRLPAEVLAGLAGPPSLEHHPEVHQAVGRCFWEAEGDASRKAFSDLGLLVSLGERHLYFPRTEPIEAAGVKDLLGLVLPVTWQRRLKLTDAPGLGALPVEAFVDSVLSADLDTAGKAALLGPVAVELGGMDLDQAIGPDGSLWGELAGRTVSIQARAPDGLLAEQAVDGTPR